MSLNRVRLEPTNIPGLVDVYDVATGSGSSVMVGRGEWRVTQDERLTAFGRF